MHGRQYFYETRLCIWWYSDLQTCVVTAFSLKMFCTFQQHCCCVTPGEALCACVCVWACICVCMCMCVASILLGKRVAPCCDCVYSFVTLWAALLSALNWHCHRMEGRKERVETVMTNQLLCFAPSSLLPLVIGQKRKFFLNTCLSSSQHSHTDPGLNLFIQEQDWHPQAWEHRLFCQRVS